MQRCFANYLVLLTLATSACGPASQTTVSITSGGNGNGPCANAPLRTGATVYYYCDCQTGAATGCVPGDDSNAGTSASAPRRSLGDALSRFQSLSPGQTVALCQGGAWSESGTWIDAPRCSASSPCDFRDYAPSWGSSLGRPIVNSTGLTMGLSGSGGGVRIWNLDHRRPVGQFDDDGQLVIADPVHDLDICNVRMTGGRLQINLETGAGGVTIRGNQFYQSGFAAVYGSASGLILDGNYFENHGLGNNNGEHTVYVMDHDGATAEGVQVTNNEMWNGRDGAICPGVQLVVHGQMHALNIENNYIHTDSTDWNCFGIMLSGGNSGGTFRDTTIRRNRVSTRGADTIYVDGCIDCVVSDNVVSGGSMSLATGGCSEVPCVQNLSVLNNTAYLSTIHFGTNQSGTGFTIANNAVWNSGGGGLSIDSRSTVRVNANNWVRDSSGPAAAAVFANPVAASGDFTPLPGSPLVGTGSSSYSSPVAIGARSWSQTDKGIPRAAPIDIGAFVH